MTPKQCRMAGVRKTELPAMSNVIQRMHSWCPGTGESTLEHGTPFSVCLPLHEPAPHDERSPTLTFKPGHGHVLLVDDEVPIVELGKELLEMFGYEVTGCASSLDALETFRAVPERYDAMIIDQTMPDLSGKDLAREILQIRPDLPIILCTGLSCTMIWEKARELGIRKILMKPFLSQEFGLALKEVMGKQAET